MQKAALNDQSKGMIFYIIRTVFVWKALKRNTDASANLTAVNTNLSLQNTVYCM